MKKKHRVLYKKLLLLFLFGILFTVVRGLWGGYGALNDAQSMKQVQEDKLNKIDDRIVGLEGKIASLDTRVGMDEELIEIFPIKRPGEEVIVLIEQKERGSGFIQKEEADKKWWQFWK